jgi:hypothetical protein
VLSFEKSTRKLVDSAEGALEVLAERDRIIAEQQQVIQQQQQLMQSHGLRLRVPGISRSPTRMSKASPRTPNAWLPSPMRFTAVQHPPSPAHTVAQMPGYSPVRSATQTPQHSPALSTVQLSITQLPGSQSAPVSARQSSELARPWPAPVPGPSGLTESQYKVVLAAIGDGNSGGGGGASHA